jgi:phosphatidylserine/phosphatidylglycerophosphate/cardiolipin synthase-like enzyme
VRPGETCWRVGSAGRLALLVDNQAYFRAVGEALRRARRSIWIFGWEFDPRTVIDPDAGEETFGDLLNRLAAERSDLSIRLLIWDAALPVSASRHFFPQRARFWLDRRIRLVLDDRHPLGACHHQKLVLVDDALAFVSGGDFMPGRWDTHAHVDGDPRRRLLGRDHAPRHDVTALVDGQAATDLADLAGGRWRRATGEALPPPEPESEVPWPASVSADAAGVEVGIARTLPGFSGPEVRESEALYLAMIATARRLIVIENQYFSAAAVGAALEARLAEPDGPEVVVVCTPHSPSYFDRLFMDAGRDALVAHLRRADRFGRFHAFAPYTAEGQGIIVHSKVMIVDDVALRVGSSNANNRSMGLDTELDLVVAAPDGPAGAPLRRAVNAFRDGLLAHYLEVPAGDLARAAARLGSYGAAIDGLDRDRPRRLRPIRPGSLGPLGRITASRHLGDPLGTFDNWRPWRRPPGPVRFPVAAVAAGAAAAGLLALAATRRDEDSS